MAFVREHGKLRPQPPRLKNVRRAERSGKRSRNQDARGRFVAGNDAPKGRALKAIIKRHLGREATGETAEQLAKETLMLFRACKAAIGSDAPQVQDTLARRARWSVLSAHYALRAVELGLETEEGQRCLELALKLDQRVERLDVTAIDLADRLVQTEGNALHEAILSAGEPAAPETTSGSPEGAEAPNGEDGA